jgi:hypothetical protein
VAVIRSIADALNLSADVLLAQVAGLDPDAAAPPLDTEAAIKSDPRLTGGQKAALLSVYRTMVAGADAQAAGSPEPGEDRQGSASPPRLTGIGADGDKARGRRTGRDRRAPG